MKLGIINGWEEGHFKAVAVKGLEAVEFCINYNYDSAEVLKKAEEIKENSIKYNVGVASIGRWGMDRIDEDGNVIAEALQHDKNLIDLASIVGCPVFNTGCNFIESKTYYENCLIAIDYFKTLIDYAEGKGVKIATYNCDWCNFVCEERAWAVVHGALPELGIKYDPSHCYNRGGDYLRELRDWGDRVCHFHVKGVLHIAGDGFDDPPAGLDGLNWGAIMTMLYVNDYNGVLSIEPHSGKWKGAKGQWGVDFTINYMKQFIMPENYEASSDPYMP
ncbi:MAG: sugar phosphate isomerase/epimerase [Clostridia bacterium]|nr:sugar phosphate isomerase/epimerase [Clostridia bacterium]